MSVQVKFFGFLLIVLLAFQSISLSATCEDGNKTVATFSIVGRDPETGELGIAVASRFFAVGTVVPWAEANIGAVATQSFANTSFGWQGLDLLEKGATPEEVRDILLREDTHPQRRQFGIVAADGQSVTFTGDECLPWAGGRTGENYACQGNILTGEAVVTAMESTFVNTSGTLSERLYKALLAGEAKGGDSRGKQSAALLVVKENSGYGGYTDRAIDIRVDDHKKPFEELGRLLKIAQLNYAWNEAWTLFTRGKAEKALPPMERAAELDPDYAEVQYDLAVIRAAADQHEKAIQALRKACQLNPKLRHQARKDDDLESLRDHPEFDDIVGEK